MASVYILFSPSSCRYYVGCTKDLTARLAYHHQREFPNSFTAKYHDWELFHSIDDLDITLARKIEGHIKRMKSKTYMENLKKHPEITKKLIVKYSYSFYHPCRLYIL